MSRHRKPAKDPHAEWIHAVVDRYERPLFVYALRLLGGDRETARDVVQDTFLKLCDQPREKLEDRLAAWLFTVCRNRSLDILRKQSRVTPLADPPECPERNRELGPLQLAQQHDMHRRVLELLEDLPPNQRECIRLKFQHGMSYKQIAEITGLSTSNVGYLIHVGLKAIRQQVQPPEPADSPEASEPAGRSSVPEAQNSN